MSWTKVASLYFFIIILLINIISFSSVDRSSLGSRAGFFYRNVPNLPNSDRPEPEKSRKIGIPKIGTGFPSRKWVFGSVPVWSIQKFGMSRTYRYVQICMCTNVFWPLDMKWINLDHPFCSASLPLHVRHLTFFYFNISYSLFSLNISLFSQPLSLSLFPTSLTLFSPITHCLLIHSLPLF